MSDMGFGYYTGDLGDGTQDDATLQQQTQDDQKPNGFRQYLKSLEDKTKKQQELLEGLMAESRRNRVADVLEAKGYDRGVAALYTGDPDKVDDWLTSAGSFLVKKPGAPDDQGAGQGQGQQGNGSTVPLDGQAQLQAFQQAGQNAAPPQGSDAEQAAAIASLDSPEKLTAYLASQGNEFARYYNG